MKLKDLRISTQLQIGMATILVLVAILGVTAWFQANDLWQETKDLYEHPLQVRRALNTLAVDILTIHRDMKDLVMADNEQERQSIIQAIDTSEADATLQFDILYDRYLGSRKDIDEIRTAFVSWKPIRTETIRLVRIGKATEALRRTKVNGVGGGQVEKLLNEIQNMINGARDRADKFYADAKNEKDSMLMQLWTLFGAILLLILGVSYVLLKNIRDPLAELTSLTEKFSQGRLDARSSYVAANEFGALAVSFNTLAATIQSEWLNKESASRLMEKVRESEEKYRQLIENSHDIIYTLTADGMFTFVSPAWTLLLGHPVTQVAGHPFQEFVHPEDIPACMVWLQKVIESGQRQEGVEYRVRHFNGSWYWHTSSAVPFKDKTGTIIGFEGTARDVTKRKQAEEESRRLSSIVLHSLELMNLTAPDGTMIFLNDAGKKMLGISEEEVVQTNIMQVIPEHLQDKVQQEVLPAIFRDGHWEGEIQYSNVKTGELTDVYATTYKIDDPKTGMVQFLANVSLDVTDRKRAEEAISAKNKEMENYLYIASHDLRSPLVNIQGFSQRLKKQADAIKAALADCALPPATKAGIDVITDDGIPKTLNFIFSNVTKMDVLLNGLLHLSRTGRAVMAIKEIDINQLFQTIIANFNFQLTQLGAIITANDIPSCYGDENLLNQLFSNIIGNAIKYHDKNRRLVIEITARKEFRKVIYSIRDTGLGMEARHLERIWDIFYRIDPILTDTGEGLGLSSSKRIAEKHHGRVWAESEAGKGSVFYVELQTTEFSEFQ